MHIVMIFMFLHSSSLDFFTKSTAFKSDFKEKETKKSYSSLLLGVNVLRRHENKHYNLLDHSQDPWIFQHAAAGWCWVEQAVLIAASVDNANAKGLSYGLLRSIWIQTTWSMTFLDVFNVHG